MSMDINDVWMAIAKYHKALGLPPMSEMDAPWIRQIDKLWWMAINGSLNGVQVDGVVLEPFHAYVKFNGWPAGVFSPAGGIIAAGKAANADTFCEALVKATGRMLDGRTWDECPEAP